MQLLLFLMIQANPALNNGDDNPTEPLRSWKLTFNASLVFDGNEIVHIDGDFGASKSVSFTLGN